MKSGRNFAAFLMAFLLLSSPAWADLLMYEGFDYTVGDVLEGKSGGVGWNGSAWAKSHEKLNGSIIDGITFGQLKTSGGSLKLSWSQYDPWKDRMFSRQIGTAPAQGVDLWCSFLYKMVTNEGKDTAEIFVLDSQFSGTKRTQSMPKVWDSNNCAVAYGSTAGTPAGDISDGSVYLVICKFTNINAAGGGTATMWALTESNFADVVAAGFSEAALDANNAVKVTNISTDQQDFATAYFVAISTRVNATWNTHAFQVDELRYATTLTEALPVTGVNNPPSANDDTYAITGAVDTLKVLDNDTDPDNDPLTITEATQPIYGTVITNPTDIIYVPPTDFLGADTFTYTVSDGNGGTDTATVTIIMELMVSGEVFLYEGFDYALDTDLVGHNGGKGWMASAWTTGGDIVPTCTIVPGLSFSDLPVSGNAVEVDNAGWSNWKGGYASRTVASLPAVGETIWASYLYQGTSLSSSSYYFASGVSIGSLNAAAAIAPASSAAPGVGYGSASTNSEAGNILNDGDTYLIVAEFTNVGGADGGTATLWALSYQQFETLKTAGITKDNLTANCMVTTTATGSETGLTSVDVVKLWFREPGNGTRANFTVDELKFGKSLTDVTMTVQPTQQLDGDANGDCKVNIIDLIFIRNRLNKDVGTADNAQADVNGDGKINIIDLIYVRNRLNDSCE